MYSGGSALCATFRMKVSQSNKASILTLSLTSRPANRLPSARFAKLQIRERVFKGSSRIDFAFVGPVCYTSVQDDCIVGGQPMADNGQDIELENVNPAVIPSESEQDFLRRVWIEGLAEMLGETKSRWEDAFRTVKAEAAAAVSELRAAAAEFRSTMEGMIAERLAQIRQPIDGKEGPRGERGQKGDKGDPGELPMARPWVDGEISYAGDV